MAEISELLGIAWYEVTPPPPPRYRLSRHAERQAGTKDIPAESVLAAANQPQHTYANRRFPGQRRHVRDGIVAVVDPSRGEIVTVYRDRVETEIRKDQVDSDARRYALGRAA